jgi:hypothetical protein
MNCHFKMVLTSENCFVSEKLDGFFLSCRNSENECFELIIDFGVKTEALSFKNIHNFVRFTDFVKIKIKI